MISRLTFRSETRDGVEVGIVTHDGKEYSALGSVVTPDRLVAYMGKKFAPTLCFITTWEGTVIGAGRIRSTWTTPRSYISSEMYQVEAVVNGVHYTGRCAGDGMIFKGKRVARQ